MSDYYKFIVKKYLKLFRQVNRQVLLTGARQTVQLNLLEGGEPVGLWTEGFQTRKHTYAGFADGLSGN